MPKNFKSDGRGYAPPINRQQEQQQNNPFGPIGGYPNPVGGYGGYSSFPYDLAAYNQPPLPVPYWPTKDYTVEKGDTIDKIAMDQGVSREEILSYNGWNLVNLSNGMLTDGMREFQIAAGMIIKIPEYDQDAEEKQSSANNSEDQEKIYTIQRDNERLDEIATQFSVTREQLLEANQLIEKDGALWSNTPHGGKFNPEKGTKIVIPPSYQGISKKKSEEVVQDAKKATEKADQGHMDVFFETLLGASAVLLGENEHSKIAYALQINIPISGNLLFLTLSGAFMQKRKAGNVIQHNLQLGVGMKADMTVAEAQVDFNVFLKASSDSLEEAVKLFSYGFYKFGRKAADELNDWEKLTSTMGTSLLPSAALYYGLNLMYSEKDDLDEKCEDIEGSEKRMAELEKELFGYNEERGNKPFDKDNPNEVSMGGSIKASAEAENEQMDLEAGVSAEIALQNTINSKTLNKTGIYGRQGEDGFKEDYKVGDKTTLTAKFSAEATRDDTGVAYSTAMTFQEKYGEDNEDSGKLKNKKSERKWKFEKEVTEASFQIGGLADGNHIATEILSERLADIGGYVAERYNKDRQKLQKYDPEATVKPINADAFKVTDSIINQKLAEKIELSDSKTLKVSDSVKVILKIIEFADQPNQKITLTIGHLTEKSVDRKLIEAEMKRFKSIATIVLME
jgi:hypothetical protein